MKHTHFSCSNCEEDMIEWNSKFTIKGEPAMHFCQNCSEILYEFIVNHLPQHIEKDDSSVTN